MKREFRVGCWTGRFNEDNEEYKEGTISLQHDSMEEEVEFDTAEIADLQDAITCIHLRIDAEYGDEEAKEALERLAGDLEA